MRSSNELSSSPEDAPKINIPPFLLAADGFGWVMPLVIMLASGVSFGFDRYEEEMCDGENPRTMLGDLSRAGFGGRTPEEETLVSEPAAGTTSLSLPSGAVVEQDSAD
jgi:hypothetical protein